MSPRAAVLVPCQSASFLTLITAFLALVLATQSVRADEVYFCEGGRMVTVRFGELEQLKRTDPCIAAHFARRAPRNRAEVPAETAAEAAARTPAGAPVGEATVIAGAGAGAGIAPPLPQRKPHDIAALAALRLHGDVGSGEVIVHHEAPPSDVDDAAAAQTAADSDLVARVTPVVFKHSRRILRPLYAGAVDERPAAAPVDFRHVPIINAQPGEPAVFHHRR